MLVTLYRSGPLRQRLAKGYTVVGRSRDKDRYRPDVRAAITERLVAKPPRLPTLPAGRPLTLRAVPRAPAALWIDTGPVVLHDGPTRRAVAAALSEAVAVVAGAARQAGGLLLPSGWVPGEGIDPSGGMCADLHSLEVVSDVQRELLCNLLREHSPSLIALTGRQLHGPAGALRRGSARLSRATDQVATRYIASFSPQHVDRVRAGLRRDERLARLEAMDVNPLGEPGVAAEGDVTLRLFDAQLSVSSAMAHALLAQALSMRVRDLERTGHRVRSVPQPLLERNRSRAVAHGLLAEFDTEQRPPAGGNSSPNGPRTKTTRTVPAVRAVSAMLSELLPYFRQLDAHPDELAQLFLGLELSTDAGAQDFVRNENDLLARWHAQDAGLLADEALAQRLGSAEWLMTDHISAANRARAAGSTSAALVWLAEQLDPTRPAAGRKQKPAGTARRPQGRPDKRSESRPGGRPDSRAGGRTAPADVLSPEQLLDRVADCGGAAEEIVAALRAYCRSANPPDLVRPLGRRDREEAKALRRLLRPRRAQQVSCDAPLASWEEPAAARALRGAGESGLALLHWDVPEADRGRVRAALRALGRPPGGVRFVLLTDTTYTGKAKDRRGTVEVLLVAPARDSDGKAAEEALS
ncbi:hypothetical protein C3489_22985 [Streptomyces sp. Ru71]|uniref:hypothetical protein n=1 Tax=Streptomyces sp. Ru71 TaxID=2080746 RepID=UPI000CDDF56C|nr:hypothetical protein [Streptomyces sp. Ru71]POX50119.1 hypothetical protein C3489_22985 [Streptomyces sp. Ru71]